MDNCILLRYGEVGLKSKRTRTRMERLYLEGIRDALKRNGITEYKIKNLGGRFIIRSSQVEEIIPVLQRVPGIQSLSPAKELTFSSKEELLQKITIEASPLVQDKIFCVKVTRIGCHDFTSIELGMESGERLYEKSKGVNFKNPDLFLYLEIRDNVGYLYTQVRDGVGGLPPKSSGKVLCLFSGGIDSPVAAYSMLKRGCEVDFMHIDLISEKSLQDMARVYNFLIDQYAFGYTPKIYLIDGKELIEKIKKEVPDKLKQIAVKIIFYQLGQRIINEEKYEALVTGEALSQKSSQTVQGLKVIQSQISSLVLRPLIGFDKTEITSLAEKIGTFVSSIKVKEYCSLSIGPVNTTPDFSILKQIPSFKELIDNAKIIKKIGVIEIDENIDANAPEINHQNSFISIDIRPKGVQELKPLKTDLSLPYPQILERWRELEKDKDYLLVCEFGVIGENAAFMIRKHGLKTEGISVKKFKRLRGE